jgi:hypothetical protein
VRVWLADGRVVRLGYVQFELCDVHGRVLGMRGSIGRQGFRVCKFFQCC